MAPSKSGDNVTTGNSILDLNFSCNTLCGLENDSNEALSQVLFDAKDCQHVPQWDERDALIDNQSQLRDLGSFGQDQGWEAFLNGDWSKLPCHICCKTTFENDLKDSTGFTSCDLDHVFSFQLPEGENEPTAERCSNNLSLLYLDVLIPKDASKRKRNELSRKTSRLKRNRKTNISLAKALSLFRDAVRSDGTISEDVFLQFKELSSKVERSQKTDATFSITIDTSVSDQTINTAEFGSVPATGSDTVLTALTEPARRRETSPALAITQPVPQRNLVSLHCTFSPQLCKWSHTARSAWQRHESSVHKHQYMCKECNSGHGHPQGGFACGFCFGPHMQPFGNLEAVKRHTLQCTEARKAGTAYSRKDGLRKHLREKHKIRVPQADAFDWVYDIDHAWWKQCGFCGVSFIDWNFRAAHVETHFKEGANISAWKVPFPLAEASSSEDSYGSDDSSDGSDDDDGDLRDNNHYDSNGPSRSSDAHGPTTWHDTSGDIANGMNYFEANWSFHAISDPRTSISSEAAHSEIYFCMQRFLAVEEQHERLVLGLERGPLIFNIPKRPAEHLVSKIVMAQERRSTGNTNLESTQRQMLGQKIENAVTKSKLAAFPIASVQPGREHSIWSVGTRNGSGASADDKAREENSGTGRIHTLDLEGIHWFETLQQIVTASRFVKDSAEGPGTDSEPKKKAEINKTSATTSPTTSPSWVSKMKQATFSVQLTRWAYETSDKTLSLAERLEKRNWENA